MSYRQARNFFLMFSLAFAFVLFCSPVWANILLSWDPPSTGDAPTGYEVCFSSTHANAVAGNCDIAQVDVGNTTSLCSSVDPRVYRGTHVSVRAYNVDGYSGWVTGYLLYGNITGDYNEGTAWDAARVDGFDQFALGVNFGLPVTHNVYSCGGSFTIIPPSQIQKCDIWLDNIINGMDLMEFGSQFGHILG